uniref:Carbonyl reductase 1 n=1 Tax=Canis lupus dingo TaxID=286419 RepID=A0A8C0R762_CANLU
MSSAPRVAVVTGANKGLGFAITRDLCRNFSGDVVLTARDEARGRAAVQQLQSEGLSPRFHLLDIDDLQSICTLRDFLCKEYRGLDVLVNNAGINFDTGDPTPLPIQAEVTLKTNFFGTRNVCRELLPLMKPQGDSPTPPNTGFTGMSQGSSQMSLTPLLTTTLEGGMEFLVPPPYILKFFPLEDKMSSVLVFAACWPWTRMRSECSPGFAKAGSNQTTDLASGKLDCMDMDMQAIFSL